MGSGAHRPGLSAAGTSERPAAVPGGQPYLIVAGPTASGKSALALAIAREFDGAIINADSMQVYRELAILTARPGAAELAAAPHHLYGVLPASERCSAGRWREMALKAMALAADGNKAKLAIVTGGTGLYLRSLQQGLSPMPDIPVEVRKQGAARLAEIGAPALHEELAAADPETAERLNPGDSQRVLRAWSVLLATGRPLADWQRQEQPGASGPSLSFVLMPARLQLYAAIDGRFRRMVELGAIEEARNFRALGLDPSLPAMKAVGVRELGRVLDGEITLEAAIAAAQQESRHYAKRQITWLRHQMPPSETIGEQFSERILPDIFAKIRQFLLTVC
jgi:tRNA dimethylallyltransferase